MASTEEEFRQVVLLMPVTEMESLRSFVAFSGGEVVSETKPSRRKRAKITKDSNVREEEDADREIPHYSLGTLREAGVSCNYCLQLPCITESEGKAAFLSADGAPRPQNILKRYKDYREFYRMLKRAGLWENSLYLDRKHELGIFIEDVREVLPNCVVADVRKRWPNPPDMPYKGHVPTL